MNIVTIKPITSDLVQYGTVTELVAHTQQVKTNAIAEGNKLVRVYVDTAITDYIIGITSQIALERGDDFALDYINRAKGTVTDSDSKLNIQIQLLERARVIEAEVSDDGRVKELEAKTQQLQDKLDKQYAKSIATKAVLQKDLERAKEVIKKLETDEDLTKAHNETARLKQELTETKDEASRAKALRSEVLAKDEALANARTQELNLKAKVARANDEAREAKAEMERNKGEAVKDYQSKQEVKSLVYTEVAKQVRESYPLLAYLKQNGMSDSNIALAQSQPQSRSYDTDDVLGIARLIYTQRNEVSDGSLLDKIEGLISEALTTVEQDDVREQYSTLSRQYSQVVRTMTEDSLEG